MKNLKTTISGLVAAAAGFVTFSPDLFAKWPWIIAVSKYVMIGGLASMGLAAKDFSTHSTAEQVEVATVDKQVEDEAAAVKKAG